MTLRQVQQQYDVEPSQAPKVLKKYNSMEFGKACEVLSWNHRTSTPHRSETNGIAERAVRRVKEGTSAVLLQSGLDERWWLDSMECCCYLRNVQDLLVDGKTQYEKRFGEPLEAPVILFGSMVQYHPISAKDQSRLHQCGKKVLLGIFLGYALYAERSWREDFLIADIDKLENLDASEIHAQKLNAKEVLTPKKVNLFTFSIADGPVKASGRELVFRKIHLLPGLPAQSEEHNDVPQGESDGSQPLDTLTDDRR